MFASLTSRHLPALTVLLAATATALPAPASALPRTYEVPTGISNAGLTDITGASDGSLWITSRNKGSILAVQPDRRVSERPLTGLGHTATPEQIAGGADGNLWITDPLHQEILRATPLGEATAFSEGLDPGSGPRYITPGADGKLWFSSDGTSALGQITTDGEITEHPSAHAPVLLTPDTAEGGGAVWFTTHEDVIGHASADGTITFLPVATTAPTGITMGPDGNVWLSTATSIVRVTPSGAVTPFTAGIAQGSQINDLVAGSDGHLWFSDAAKISVGRITTAGSVSVFPTVNEKAAGGNGAPPLALSRGRDGELVYFGRSADDLVADVVGVASTAGIPTGTLLGAEDITTSSASVSATVDAAGGDTAVSFEYGLSVNLGRATQALSLAPLIIPMPVTAALTSLDPKRLHYYRVSATNRMGTWKSEIKSFSTPNVAIQPLPPLPAPPASVPTPGTTLLGPGASTNPIGLQLDVKAAKVAKGIVKVRVTCGGTTACAGTVAVTARVKGKKSKASVIATKRVKLAAGATAKVGLRLTSAGQRAVRRAGAKGLSTLAVVTIGNTKQRSRLTLKR